MAEACGVTDPPPEYVPDPPLCEEARARKVPAEATHRNGPPALVRRVQMMIA